MSFEDLLEAVGSFGLYQRVICFTLIPLGTTLCGLTFYAQIFILAAPQHVCNGNLSLNQSDASTSFNTSLFDKKMSCQQMNEQTDWIDCQSGWTYNYDVVYPTLTSENNWICGESWKPYAIVSSFWAANTIGAWVFGIISDRYGRRPGMALSFTLYAVSGIASVFFQDFWTFFTLRTLLGFSHHTISHLPFLFVMEHCGVNSRHIPLLAIMVSYTTASALTPLLAYFVWNWKLLAILTSIPSVLMVVSCKWLPESPSWLMAKNRQTEAFEQLEKISRTNGCYKSVEQLMMLYDKPTETLQHNDKQTNVSIVDCRHYPRLMTNICLALLLWTFTCFCYYGHCFNTSNLGSNIFMSYFFGGLVEILSWITPWLINHVGRKRPLIGALLIAGVSGILSAIVPVGTYYMALLLALLARIAISVGYCVMLQYGPEIFPTVIRGQGLAMTETLGSIGIFVAPLVVYMGEFFTSLPMLIFSIVALVGGACALILPETRGVNLPHTLHDGQTFTQKQTT